MRWLRAPCALLAVAAGSAQAQTMLDQEQRLIEIHSLLVALQPGNPPGAYRPGEVSLGLEIIVIPSIDGTTGGKRQITASDRTPAFPRPRFAIGLPAPTDFRAFVGLAYIPPIAIRSRVRRTMSRACVSPKRWPTRSSRRSSVGCGNLG